jgi:hypothetical protein
LATRFQQEVHLGAGCFGVDLVLLDIRDAFLTLRLLFGDALKKNSDTLWQGADRNVLVHGGIRIALGPSAAVREAIETLRSSPSITDRTRFACGP